MIIDWNPSEQLKKEAIRISELKSEYSYTKLAGIFDKHKTYIIELKKLGDKLRKEQSENQSN